MGEEREEGGLLIESGFHLAVSFPWVPTIVSRCVVSEHYSMPPVGNGVSARELECKLSDAG